MAAATTSHSFRNTLRYGALSFGVIYGFVHHASLSSSAKQDRLYHEKLAQYQNFLKAREAFQHHQQPHHHHHDSSSSSLITDPENPKFDLEKIIEFYAAKA